MSNNLNMRVINFQDNIRSKPVRENFSDIETEFNSLKAEADNLSSSTSTSEIITSRDDHVNLYDRLRANNHPLGNGVIFDFTTLDACNEITNWTAAGDASALAVETDNYIYGYQSIKAGKSGVASSFAYYDVDFANNVFDNCYVVFNIYIASEAVLNDLNSAQAIEILLAKDAGYVDARRYDFTRASLHVGWNELKCDFNDPTSTSGTVANSATIIEGRVFILTNNDADTITSGDILIDNVYKQGTYLRVIEQSTPGMTVRALAGIAVVNGYGVYFASTENSGTITAPTVNPRIDIIRVNSSGLSIVTGAEAASPVPPEVGDDYAILAYIYNRTTETQIDTYDGGGTEGYIIDKREIPKRENWGHETDEFISKYRDKETEYYTEDDSIQTETAGNYADALVFTFTPAVSGDYLINWSFELWSEKDISNPTAITAARAKVIEPTVAVLGGEYTQGTSYVVAIPADDEGYGSFAGMKKRSLTSGTAYTYKIQFHGDSGTWDGKVQNCRMHARRIEV